MIEGRAGLALGIRGGEATLRGGEADLVLGKGGDLIPEIEGGGASLILVTGDEVGPIPGTGNEAGLVPEKEGETDPVTNILNIGLLQGTGSDPLLNLSVHSFSYFSLLLVTINYNNCV